MASLSGNETARTTARFGAARFGATRFGYSPRDTVNSAGVTGGPLVFYTRIYPAGITYTVVKQ